jgi:L-alanine-DL-glutamate epimerase-like enolase superfamily enzyme
MALVDLAAKSLGVHITHLFGGPQRRSVEVHGSVGWSRQKDDMAKSAAEQATRYPWIKVYVGRDELSEDLSRLRAVRKAVGDITSLLVDINGLWTRSDALDALPVLQELDVAAVEQPLDPSDDAGQAMIARNYRETGGIDVVLDERVREIRAIHDASNLGLGHVVNIGVSKLGGLTVALEAVRSAQEHHLPVSIGSLTELGVATSAGITLAALATGLGRIPTALNGPEHFAEHVTVPELVPADGRLELPHNGAGFGCEISERLSACFEDGR